MSQTMEIPLTQGKFAKIDNEDYDLIKNHKWCYNKGYAKTAITLSNGKQKLLSMHRVILGLTDSKIQCDHINHDGLDNTKKNLRPCTHQQSHMNKSSAKNSSSKYLGVSWHKNKDKWQSSIMFNNKQIHIGIFHNEEEAAKAYNNKAKELFGEFANLNIIGVGVEI
jgi:hypothetical protein